MKLIGAQQLATQYHLTRPGETVTVSEHTASN